MLAKPAYAPNSTAPGFAFGSGPQIVPGVSHANRPNPPAAPSALTLVAHDLRGPLASLRLLVELIESYGERQNPEKIASCASRACSIIDGLEDMLNSLLERVLKTGDPLGFDPSPLEFNGIIEGAVANNHPAAEGKAVFLLNRPCRPLRVHGDPQLLYQAVENLIGNAIKHSSAGMSVDCSLRKNGKMAVLCIQDMGAGLTRMDIKSAFRPFTTLSSKSTDKSRSWGLGLWIVKLILEQHGGTVAVTSDGPGKGATFTIELPLCD